MDESVQPNTTSRIHPSEIDTISRNHTSESVEKSNHLAHELSLERSTLKEEHSRDVSDQLHCDVEYRSEELSSHVSNKGQPYEVTPVTPNNETLFKENPIATESSIATSQNVKLHPDIVDGNDLAIPKEVVAASLNGFEASRNKAAMPNVVNAKRFAADQTVAARLSRLEKSLTDLVQNLPSADVKDDQDVSHQPVEAIVTSITTRLSTVEHILHGFGDIDVTKVRDPKADSKLDIDMADVTNQIADSKTVDGEEPVLDKDGVESQDWSIVEADEARNGIDKVKNLVSHLDERESRTELTIRELATEITDLKARIDSREMNTDATATANEIELMVSKLSDHLERQLSELTTSIKDKVSKKSYARETQSIREALEACKRSLESNAVEPSDELARLASTLADTSLKIEELAKSKLDQDEFHQLMDSKDASLRSLVEDEIAKQNLYVSSSSEKMANEIKDVRSMVNAHMSMDSQLTVDTGIQSNVSVHQSNNTENVLIEPNNLEAMIQQAATSVRDSLEESLTKRLDELKAIEHELNGLVSQLAEKPGKDQVDSVLQTLEANISERISQDTELQFLIENMKKGERHD